MRTKEKRRVKCCRSTDWTGLRIKTLGIKSARGLLLSTKSPQKPNMDLGGGGNGGVVSGIMPDERKGGSGRLDFASNGQTAGYHNNSQGYGE